MEGGGEGVGRKDQSTLEPSKAVQAGSCAVHCQSPPSQGGDEVEWGAK